MLPRYAITVLLLLVLGSPPVLGENFDRFLTGLQSRDTERRRECLERLLADSSFVPEGRWSRVRRPLISILERDKDRSLRALAARCLVIERTCETDAKIIERLRVDRDWRVQRGCMEALTGLSDDALVGLLVKRAYREPRNDIRALWVEALGRCRHPKALSSLQQLAGMPVPWPAAIAAAVALQRHPGTTTVDRLIDLLWREDDGVRSAAFESLVHVTGIRDLPPEPAKWVEWWAKAREGFKFPGAAAKPDADVTTVARDPVTVPTYYDIPIRGQRVIFCLDVSASMWGPKFEAATAELSRAIRCLPSTHRFNVIFFNEHPFPWRKDLLPALPFQKLECVTAFDEMETKMYTNIFDTLERALGFAGLGRRAIPDPPGVDDVFLLTDGEPNRGRYRDERGILAGLAEIDPHLHVRIHTISVGDVSKALMTAIAEARGGRHAHVDAAR